MINTSQLQIGSKIAFGTSFPNEPLVWTVTEVSVRAVVAERNGETRVLLREMIQPVPLTTDWLKRAGFEEVTMSWYTEPCYAIVIQGETFFYWLTEQKLYWDETFLRKVDAVHELQLLMSGLGRPITFDGK